MNCSNKLFWLTFILVALMALLTGSTAVYHTIVTCTLVLGVSICGEWLYKRFMYPHTWSCKFDVSLGDEPANGRPRPKLHIEVQTMTYSSREVLAFIERTMATLESAIRDLVTNIVRLDSCLNRQFETAEHLRLPVCRRRRSLSPEEEDMFMNY